MSPASKSKSKDKSSSRAAKEQKISPKPSSNTGNNISANAYNPLSGTFHTLQTSPAASSSPPHNMDHRFRSIDEIDEHSGSSHGTGAEYDSVSNNDSCSGESEDQKEKPSSNTTVRQEAIPGSDNDKREKIRQKNERKHQRQKEKRAQELHERCSGFLMSRKLEALSQQLVAMGFSSERATMALILNEGRVEESVAWLLEGGEEAAQHNDSNVVSGSNLKIDISEELAWITDMEKRFKCSKQEVERIVVACEGDLEKAAETLRSQKQEPPSVPLKPEETGGKVVLMPGTQNSIRPQVKPISAFSITTQQRRDERDFNYTKSVVTSSESGNRNLQSLRRIQARPQVVVTAPADKGCSSLQVQTPPTKMEARYIVVGNEVKNLQTGALKEPVIMMQRPQKQNTIPVTAGQYLNSASGVEILKSANTPVTAGGYSGVKILKANGGSPHVPSTTSQQFYHQPHYQSFVPSGTWNSTGTTASSPLAVPSSLGLFSGWGSTGTSSGSSSPVDWNTGGSMPHCDYTNIDWTLDSTVPSRPNGLWLGLESFVNKSQMYDSSWSAASLVGGTNPSMMMRSSSNVKGGYISGMQDGGMGTETSSSSSSGSAVGSYEWTSPFAGKDLFSVSRQYVTSPSL